MTGKISVNRRRILRALLSRFGRGVVLIMAGCALVFAGLPLISLIWRGIREGSWRLVPQGVVQQAITLSLTTTSISLLLILVFGTPLAYLLARHQFRGKRLVHILIQLPIVLPPAVAGLALLLTFGRRGLLGPVLDDLAIQVVFTRTAVILAQTFVAMPYYVRAAQVGFYGVDPTVEEAALVDGATNWWRFVYVTVPLSSRSLISGALLSWARAMGEFGATILFAGSLPGRTQTMPLLIYSVFERDINAAIWTALILVGIAAAVLFALHMLTSGDDLPGVT